MRMGLVHKSLHPPASVFIGICQAWIEEYNRTAHAGQGMSGMSPEQVFRSAQRPNARPAPQPEALAIMLAEQKTVTVSECAVRANSRRYIGAGEDAVIALHSVNTLKVRVAFDPLDADHAAILDLDGNFLCWAKSETFLPQSPAANDAIAESLAQRRRLEKSQYAVLDSISDAAQRIGVKTDLEVLAQKALPAAVNDVVTQRKPMPQRLAAAASAPALAIDRSAFADRFLEDE
jgi:hypothetical protein